MKIYISGKRNEKERYKEAEEKLKKEGHEVINYLEVSKQLPGMTRNEHEAMEHMLIKLCDAVFVLNGWNTSITAKNEVLYALDNSINITFQQVEKVEELPFV